MTTPQAVMTRIKSDLGINSTDYDTQILGAIQSALRENRGKRYWFLKEYDTITLLSGSNNISLPSDFSAPKEFTYIFSGTIRSHGNGFDYYRDFDDMKRDFWLTDPLLTSNPRACAVLGSSLYVSDLADANYTINVTYYKQDATLPGVTDSSVWLDEGFEVIRTRAQYIFKRDSKHHNATEADGDRVTEALLALDDTHIARTG